MEINFDLFEQFEDLYEVKARHLSYLNALLPDGWQATIPGGYGSIWDQREWKFVLKALEPLPKPIKLLIPTRMRLAAWTMLGFTNGIVMEVSPDSLGDFLASYLDNPAARRNLAELFFGDDMVGPGMKAFGSLVVCAREENRFLDRYLPLLRAFAENDPREVGTDAELKETATGFFREIDDFRRYLDSDLFMHRRFSKDLRSLFREGVSVGILGYGEVSRVMSLAREGGRDPSPSPIAYKKMPPFTDRESVESYAEVFDRYHELLKEIGINPPSHGIRQIKREDGTVTVFATQARIPAGSVASSIAAKVSPEELVTLFRMVLEEERKVAEHNAAHPELSVGIDIRISNWGVGEFRPGDPHIHGGEKLYYLDTSTPLIRENGTDLLDPEILLARAPRFLTEAGRSRYLQMMSDRCYDTRTAVVDLLADFVTEGRAEAVTRLVEEANRFFRESLPGCGCEPVTENEVKKYHRRLKANLRFSRAANRFAKKGNLKRNHRPHRSG